MFTRTEKRGFKKDKQTDLMIFTTEEGASEHSGGAVSHTVGSEEVTIRSNVPSWGAIPVSGREELRLLRDALVKVCEVENID